MSGTFDEEARLAALRRYEILDSAREEAFDELARLAAHVCRTPIALIDFVEADRVWVKASLGFPLAEIRRGAAFATRVLQTGGLTTVTDTLQDEILAAAPFVTGDPFVRFCAGLPLLAADGLPIGTLSVMDVAPRSLSAEQAGGLYALCRQVMTELERERTLRDLQRSIVEREEAERALQEAEVKFRTLVEQVPAIAYIWDMHPEPGRSHHLYTSPQSEGMLGFTPEDWIENVNLFEEQLHPDDRERVEEETRLSEEAGGPISMEYRLLARDGRVVWFRDEAVVTGWDEDGRPKVVQGVLFDITERKLVEEELRLTLEREHLVSEHLRTLDELKNLQLHTVSHDLRSPIAAVLGSALSLANDERDLSPDTRDELLRGIVVSARKLERLVTDLLDLDRLEQGALEPDLRVTDIGELARRVVAEVGLPHHPVELDLDPAEGLVDPVQVERIVENLVLNAGKHTPAGTTIWVRVRKDADGVRLFVEDSGPGVSPEAREVIFQAFRRVGEGPGLGIGLSLVARFAELHGGRAWVEDREGGGASFQVLLPAAPDRTRALTV